MTSADIGRALTDLGFDIDRRRILLDSAIKQLGSTDVVIHIHRGIDVTIPVRVVRPGEDPDAVAPEFVAEGALETAAAAVEPAADEAISAAVETSETGPVAE